MRGAFGKAQGTVARVHIGQPIMSCRVRDQHQAQVIEALRRSKFKFPGRQLVCSLVNYVYQLPASFGNSIFFCLFKIVLFAF